MFQDLRIRWSLLVPVVAMGFVSGSAHAVPRGVQARPGLQCRTGLASYRLVMQAPSLTATTEGTCTFNREALEGTCTNEYTDTRGVRLTSTTTTRYASIEDVVDEVSVVPPLMRLTGATTTTSGAPLFNTTGTSAITYDGLKRPITMTAVSQPSGQMTTTRYSAWDLSGRPTAATVIAGGQVSTQSFSYSDSSRTQTMTSAGGTCSQTFDENGNPATGTCSGSTTTTTVTATRQICR